MAPCEIGRALVKQLLHIVFVTIALMGCALTQPSPVTDGKETAWGPIAGAAKVYSLGDGLLKVKVGNCVAFVEPQSGSQLANQTTNMKQLLVAIGRERTFDTSDCDTWSELVKQDAADLPQNQVYPRERRGFH